MKKKFGKRFQLNKSTVAHLSNQEQNQVKAGAISKLVTCNITIDCTEGETCPTICINSCVPTTCTEPH